ncbi:hypothetical protein IWQ60_005347 [Tieghemiomyces parasiticus]|uniref:Uncharacterized protein n=1 Tax=Tieghemiomyces parasiticus TaxID=78921 RepID=A0A9W8A698_9FUNG|nr:hypothetical protein IWQ60_005347 [Tieghemiomyces parasiticus]
MLSRGRTAPGAKQAAGYNLPVDIPNPWANLVIRPHPNEAGERQIVIPDRVFCQSSMMVEYGHPSWAAGTSPAGTGHLCFHAPTSASRYPTLEGLFDVPAQTYFDYYAAEVGRPLSEVDRANLETMAGMDNALRNILNDLSSGGAVRRVQATWHLARAFNHVIFARINQLVSSQNERPTTLVRYVSAGELIDSHWTCVLPLHALVVLHDVKSLVRVARHLDYSAHHGKLGDTVLKLINPDVRPASDRARAAVMTLYSRQNRFLMNFFIPWVVVSLASRGGFEALAEFTAKVSELLPYRLQKDRLSVLVYLVVSEWLEVPPVDDLIAKLSPRIWSRRQLYACAEAHGFLVAKAKLQAFVELSGARGRPSSCSNPLFDPAYFRFVNQQPALAMVKADLRLDQFVCVI